MSSIVFEIMKIFIMLVVAVAVFLIQKYAVPLLKEKTETDTFEMLKAWAETAVLAAEQFMKDHKGQDKKNWVAAVLMEFITSKHIEISYEQIEALIECAVKEMKDCSFPDSEQKGDSDGSER